MISKIINTLHLDLNKSEVNNSNLIQNESSDEIIQNEEEERNKKYEQFLKECKENNNSIIFDMFYGIKEIKVKCNKCNKSQYKYEIMNLIEIPINNYIKEENANNNYIINIKDCLNKFSEEKKQNENLVIECHFCNEYQNYSQSTIICKYPKIFIICFSFDNYFEYKNNIKIELDEKIELINDKYKLFAIISLEKKVNSNIIDEQYLAYIVINKKWIFYDDKKFKSFDFKLNKQKIMPVVLFYKKIKQ